MFDHPIQSPLDSLINGLGMTLLVFSLLGFWGLAALAITLFKKVSEDRLTNDSWRWLITASFLIMYADLAVYSLFMAAAVAKFAWVVGEGAIQDKHLGLGFFAIFFGLCTIGVLYGGIVIGQNLDEIRRRCHHMGFWRPGSSED